MQGTWAHERVMPATGGRIAMPVASVAGGMKLTHIASGELSGCGATVTAEPPGADHHEHCPCCTTSCGVHCAVLLTAWRFEPRSLNATLPPTLAEPRRDGLTHAPLLRPPIG
jgi:hypothetical protein